MSMRVSHSVLSTALARVLPFSDNNAGLRRALECVYFEGDHDTQTLNVVTANGWLMANVEIPAALDGPFDKAIIAEVLQGFTRAKSKFDVLIDFESSMKGAHVYEGKYPDYRAIFPKGGYVVSALVDYPLRAAFMRLRDIAKWSKKSSNWNSYSEGVIWSISRRGHVLEMQYEQGKVIFEVLSPVTIEKPIYAAVNVNYVCQVLDVAKDLDDLSIGMNAKNQVLVFSSAKEKARWAVMPMHYGDYVAREV